MLRAHDPSLYAAAVVAGRQADHLRTADGFVDAHLSDLDAFSGVLSVFRDEYAAALGHVHAGIEASASRAAMLRAAFLYCRREYALADENAAHELGDRRVQVGHVAPVVLPGQVGPPPPPAPEEDPGSPDLPDVPLPGEDPPGDGPAEDQSPGDQPSDDQPSDGPRDKSDMDRIQLEDRGGTPIESPLTTLLEETEVVHQGAEDLRDGLGELGSTLGDLQDYHDFEAAS